MNMKAPQGNTVNDVEFIYQQYLKAFKKGVYNYIKEEPDPMTNQVMPRKYFSGGVVGSVIPEVLDIEGPGKVNKAQLTNLLQTQSRIVNVSGDMAMTDQSSERWEDAPWSDRIFKALSELNHQCFPKVRIHEGEKQFQWVEGKRLSEKVTTLNDKDFEYQVTKWFVEITEALLMLETRGIIHGDINPSNIVIDEKTNQPVLIDWSDEVSLDDISTTIDTIRRLPRFKIARQFGVLNDRNLLKLKSESENFYSERFRSLLNQKYSNMNGLYIALRQYLDILNEAQAGGAMINSYWKSKLVRMQQIASQKDVSEARAILDELNKTVLVAFYEEITDAYWDGRLTSLRLAIAEKDLKEAEKIYKESQKESHSWKFITEIKNVYKNATSDQNRQETPPPMSRVASKMTRNVAENILGVSRGVPLEKIRKAYRTLARQYHPDKNPGNKVAEERMIKINEAYEVLTDAAMTLNSSQVEKADFKLGEVLQVIYGPKEGSHENESPSERIEGRYVYRDTKNNRTFMILVPLGADKENHNFRLTSFHFDTNELGMENLLGVKRTPLQRTRYMYEPLTETMDMITKESIQVALTDDISIRIQKDYNFDSPEKGEVEITINDDGSSFQEELNLPEKESAVVTAIKIIRKAIEIGKDGSISSDNLIRALNDFAMSTPSADAAIAFGISEQIREQLRQYPQYIKILEDLYVEHTMVHAVDSSFNIDKSLKKLSQVSEKIAKVMENIYHDTGFVVFLPGDSGFDIVQTISNELRIKLDGKDIKMLTDLVFRNSMIYYKPRLAENSLSVQNDIKTALGEISIKFGIKIRYDRVQGFFIQRDNSNIKFGSTNRAMTAADWKLSLSKASSNIMRLTGLSVYLKQKEYEEKLEGSVHSRWDSLPPEAKELIMQYKIDDIAAMVKAAGSGRTALMNAFAVVKYMMIDEDSFKRIGWQVVEIANSISIRRHDFLMWGFKAARDALGKEMFKKEWPQLVEISKETKQGTLGLFWLGFKNTKEVLGETTFEEQWPQLIKMAKASGEDAGTLFEVGFKNARDYLGQDIFTKKWPQLVEMAKEHEGDYTFSFLNGSGKKSSFSTIRRSQKDYYAILEVPITATDEDIKKAYRRLARNHHPDVTETISGESMKEINEAHEILGNPQKRRNYDNNLAMITNTGGIDLNPAQMSMQVKKEGQDFKFDFNGTEIDAAQVTGVTFTIRTMTPVINLQQILGLTPKPIDNPNLE
jgi:curved DNA-binding protein CbpA